MPPLLAIWHVKSQFVLCLVILADDEEVILGHEEVILGDDEELHEDYEGSRSLGALGLGSWALGLSALLDFVLPTLRPCHLRNDALVDHPTQLICIWMSTYKGKRHSRVICYDA